MPIPNFILTSLIGLIFVAIAAAVAFYLGINHRKKIAESKIGSAEIKAVSLIEEAKKEAETQKKELLLEAKEDMLKVKNELDKESKERRSEWQKQEKRITQKEEVLEKKVDLFEEKEESFAQAKEDFKTYREKIDQLYIEQMKELERISGMTTEEAKKHILTNVEQEVTHEMVVLIKNLEYQAKLDADKKAREIIATAIQKCAVDHVTETTVSVVSLPNDEIKGRIIGREGRNIRTLETLTGIDLIIDDTPEAVVLSGFDPMRREIARIALEKLIADGRVHPARIEEMVEKARKEVEVVIREEGENATFETGVNGVHAELVRLLGRMKYRTSYGQNVLKHSVEVAHLCGLMAAELGIDVTMAKRAGLLHDIGKAISYEVEGSHVTSGVSLARKYGESDIVINSIESHHGDVEPTSIIAVLVQAADAISAARPGARREPLESYIKRLEKLEDIANDFEGVEKSFAIQAGRELRVVIIPEEVDDDGLVLLSRKIAKKVEEELEYSGQIKINLIRETRAIEYAK